MVRLVFKGPLSQEVGPTLDIEGGGNLTAILKKTGKEHLLLKDGKPRPGVIILVNGKDWRLTSNILSPEDTVEIIPVNHGG
jgi:molybdopterin synthase sulfur carrier subunit